ncbi:MAG: hypothetical protein M2R45_01200 [Verrucomicrobia subdivision 3 bacterium]|nr:hypothetical protein [Limisphaerales bacterium]MCS1415248.1 hypothetical protein [Limisphaerales bacterium]
MADEYSVLATFYDPSSRRMKAASVPYPPDKYEFYYRERVYVLKSHLMVGTIYSKDEKVIGFGVFHLDAELWACPAFNALNAVIDGRRNDMTPDRDPFSEISHNKHRSDAMIYWYLTETWVEFEERVNLAGGDPDITSLGYWPIIYWPVGGDGLYVWEGVSDKGLRNDDCIIEIDNYLCGDPGFELATENIPQRIDARTFRPPSQKQPPEAL